MGEQSTFCHVPDIVPLWSKYFCRNPPGDDWGEHPSVTMELTIANFIDVFQDARSVSDGAGDCLWPYID